MPTKKIVRKAVSKAKKTVSKAKKSAAKAPAPERKNVPSEGATAPGFSLQGTDGQTHSLADHRGNPVVLYFYPKDDTPGCTKEACDFRDNMGRAKSAGAVVYGVSRDSLERHDKFKSKYGLNFVLLSDPELAAHKAYGAWGKKTLYGRVFDGTIRSTFLIDRAGTLARAWPKVSVTGHVDEVLAAVASLP